MSEQVYYWQALNRALDAELAADEAVMSAFMGAVIGSLTDCMPSTGSGACEIRLSQKVASPAWQWVRHWWVCVPWWNS